ncbi:hypothetical protein [Mucilaginibacter auburnensis]|uniref:Uncharacterized protein n=1 Tax=Mucilaginibacter auburnensis TaxID=1457233 RepID=A0A2H9VS32_9SPHI|nr:hypothetical protein [Mucilaginibacter auburnensis]PJJ83612.1 hypothetical protein CLV57_0598 [Mucilaginibacter auburnensis]
MDSLAELISLLDKPDLIAFKQFLVKKNKRADTKNIRLLNLIETDDIKGIKKLYKTQKSDDAYHALRKRLQDNLLLFLSQRTFESSHFETYDALRLVVVGRFLLENDVVKVAFKCLNKAENIAKHQEQFNLVNEILLLKIQYAHLSGAEDFESLTRRFTDNQLAMQREAKLNMAYAFLRQQLQEIHLKGKVVNLTDLITATIRKYQIAVEELMTYRSVYQIMLIANEYAAIQQNYRLIENYVERAALFIKDQKHNKQPYLFYHTGILYFLANYHLRCRQFSASAAYLNEMATLMGADSRYHNSFYLRHQLLTALNLFYTGKADDAVSILRKSLSGTKKTYKAEEVEDIQVCLTMFLALCNNKDCLKLLSSLTRTDAWYEKQMGMLWTIRKNLMEILIQAQFGNIEPAMSRLNSFRRRYKKYLLKTSEDRVLLFLKQVEQYLIKPHIIQEPAFQQAVLKQLKIPANGDIFSLSFISWLIARWDKRSSYEVMLSLINNTE